MEEEGSMPMNDPRWARLVRRTTLRLRGWLLDDPPERDPLLGRARVLQAGDDALVLLEHFGVLSENSAHTIAIEAVD